MPRLVRAALGASATLFAFAFASLGAADARAAGGVAKWTEWHPVGDDVRISLGTEGVARIEHALRYRIVMGPLHQIELAGLEKTAVIAPEATVTSDDGRELPAHVEAKGDGGIRVLVDEPKGLKRGSYTFRLHYDVDLVAAKELVKDGAMWRLNWRSPLATEGYDDARVTLRVPPAPTEPRAVKTGPRPQAEAEGAGEGGEDGVVATLRRAADADELELVRPHVTRGESPVWAARLDPKAFPGVVTHELRPPPPPPPPEPNRVREVLLAVGALALAGLFGALVRAKMRAFKEACERAGATPQPLVPLSPALLGACASLAFGGGLTAQLFGWTTLGALVLAAGMACAVSRPPAARRAPRGPGRWIAVSVKQALTPAVAAGHWLDVGTGTGKLAAAAAFVAVVVLGALSRALGPEAPYLVAIDALVLVPLFVTGRRVQLPPDLAKAPAPLLAPVCAALKKDASLDVAPWVRVPVGTDVPDELRLLVLPKASLPGLVGIELGIAWTRTATGYAPRAEVLVRVHDGSDAAARLPKLAPFARPVTGRRQDEKVIRLTPALPGRAAAVALVRRIALEVTDRRVVLGGWQGPERRFQDATDKVPAAA